MTLHLTRRRLLQHGAATALLPLAAGRAWAAYPERPITFICPWPAGGTADQAAHQARKRFHCASV